MASPGEPTKPPEVPVSTNLQVSCEAVDPYVRSTVLKLENLNRISSD